LVKNKITRKRETGLHLKGGEKKMIFLLSGNYILPKKSLYYPEKPYFGMIWPVNSDIPALLY
jgi:hypothetical protein